MPGGPLTSKPTWSNPSGYSTTSAFFSLPATWHGRNHLPLVAALGRGSGGHLLKRIDVMSTATSSRKGPSLVRLRERRRRSPGRAWVGCGVFILSHVACLAVYLTGTNVLALTLCGTCYFLQIVGVTAGYHRYFSHRSYKTSRPFPGIARGPVRPQFPPGRGRAVPCGRVR